MKAWIFSDLHQEFLRDPHYGQHPLTEFDPAAVVPDDFDVVVAAGDVEVTVLRSLRWLADRFPGVPTIYVPGNHDFYVDADSEEGTRTIDELSKMARELADRIGVTLLLDDTVEIDGTRFIGGTLWTDFYAGGGTLQHHISEARGPRGMTDYKAIRRWSTAQPGKRKRARPEDTIAMHRKTRAYIESVLADPFAGETVVVTHHAPHPKSLDSAHGGRLDWCYSSDLSSIMTGPTAPSLWLHGHIHRAVDYTVGGTRVLSNPRGYAFDDDERARAGFRSDFVVEIGDPVPRPPRP